MQGRYAYLADGEGGLVIVDVGDPFTPLAVARATYFGDSVLEVAMADHYVYAATVTSASADYRCGGIRPIRSWLAA